MITPRQAKANKSNAQKSTGPKTAEGKANSKMNAVTHGLLSQFALMPGEDTDQFEALRAMLFEEFQPGGGYEDVLVDNLTAQFWRLARLMKMESDNLGIALKP